MHLVRFQRPGERPRVGVLEGDTVAALRGVDTMAELLRLSLTDLRAAVGRVADAGQVSGVRLLPPVDGRAEVWCAGVTYERSRGARMEESSEQSVYDRVYSAPRPELFPKAPAWRVVTDGEPIGIRSDSGHDVPEPELAVVVNSRGEIVGYTVCNDVSSRSIEGENPLYIPQAKVFAGGCALATGIRPAWEVPAPTELTIDLAIRRGGTDVFTGTTTTSQLKRSLPELVQVLFQPNEFPDGVVLATGTGIVPELDFALAEGDEVEISISEVGTLTNQVTVGKAAFQFLADRSDPGISAELGDPTDQGDSGDPVDPADPTDPVDPTDPSDPVDPSDPADPGDPPDPGDPGDPPDPSDPGDPLDRADGGDAAGRPAAHPRHSVTTGATDSAPHPTLEEAR